MSANVETDMRFMARALALAERARGRTSPNPLVGCVLVRDGEVIGEGWHHRAGEPHAEVVALRAAGEARGATAYVTLEPCAHTGRTPPCTGALIGAGVKRVVIATRDPNPRVNGRGVARLQAAGMEVLEGVLEAESRAQNEAFFTVQQRGRPWVLYKAAMSLDGKTATVSGQSRWITGPSARERVHRWRDELDAVAVGISTVLRDDPQLTCRVEGGRSPVKVVFDSLARTPVSAKLFKADEKGVAARVLIFASEKAATRLEVLRDAGAEVEILPADARGRVEVRAALTRLAEKGINSLLLEGGGTLAWSFFEARAVDKVAVFIAPKLLGGSGASPLGGLGVDTPADAITLNELQSETVGGDLLLTGRPNTAPAEPQHDLATAGDSRRR